MLAGVSEIEVQLVVGAVKLSEWRWMIELAAKYPGEPLPRWLLRSMRSRLDPLCGEFDVCLGIDVDVEQMRSLVDAALGAGVDPHVPDDVSELDDGEPRRDW
jgi:hypothetical protein